MTSTTSKPITVHITVHHCPTLPNIINTTDLITTRIFESHGKHNGTTWTHLPTGLHYISPIRNNQEYFDATILIPQQNTVNSTQQQPYSSTIPKINNSIPEELLRKLHSHTLSGPQTHLTRLHLAHLGIITIKSERDKFFTLHHTLGHRSIRATLRFAKAYNINIGKYASATCDSCQLYKMKKRPTSQPILRIKHVNPHTGKESKPLADWNADIYGPIATPSLFGNHRYILSFIDRNTKLSLMLTYSALHPPPFQKESTSSVNNSHPYNNKTPQTTSTLYSAKQSKQTPQHISNPKKFTQHSKNMDFTNTYTPYHILKLIMASSKDHSRLYPHQPVQCSTHPTSRNLFGPKRMPKPPTSMTLCHTQETRTTNHHSRHERAPNLRSPTSTHLVQNVGRGPLSVLNPIRSPFKEFTSAVTPLPTHTNSTSAQKPVDISKLLHITLRSTPQYHLRRTRSNHQSTTTNALMQKQHHQPRLTYQSNARYTQLRHHPHITAYNKP